jgi:isoleucyl-tRNA synthetase
VKTITLTAAEENYGVKYKLNPDHKVLGQKLKKDFGKVKKGLMGLTEADARSFAKNGKLSVAGIELGMDDLQVTIKRNYLINFLFIRL